MMSIGLLTQSAVMNCRGKLPGQKQQPRRRANPEHRKSQLSRARPKSKITPSPNAEELVLDKGAPASALLVNPKAST